ncbi:hypothetical protein EN837_05525 [bacterium M00.F.Ca.ET.194.01.1.1]|uniref:hypothetical protein n=1 Tax=Agrobacterium pusense TaxID=648995 RepID=UPI001091FD91|nr:hypothetical protein [Agrobacterium pusense]TGR70908.1 hypothetical protein EN837_05525 [bacterium M00.F.Ca.ET.194.01.1.1]TGS55760.1 hypothetical protein EN822_05525 [bacterium M00.F.Ca.ET.179.01.1.1]TGV48670.1 hypothetical protein EN811_05525 [bacterium M00.F.Ca.ET.168.01.1.1]
MLAKLSGISFLAVVASAIAANSACLKEADIQRQNADLKSHSEDIGRKDGSVVSIYRQKGSARFVEVVRQNRCIATIKVLSADELDRKYDLMASLWDERAIAQEEALDNEGMDEGDDTEVISDADLPFLSMDQFPVSRIYSGPIRLPDFNGRDRDFATFRTRISNGMKAGVNFSGQYAITQIGCGSSCSIAFVSDLKTGQQFRFPYGGEEAGPMTLKHSAGSRLLIATWRDGDQCVLESMTFNAGTWDSLAKHPIGDSDACYEDIDDNISAFKSKREMSGANEVPASGNKSANAGHAKAQTDSEQPANVIPNAGMTEYDNINVAAMLDLYEGYDSIRACFKARENQFPAYLSRQEMDKAEADFLSDEAEILKRDPRIDKQDISRKSHELNALFTMAVVLTGMKEMNYEHWKACRKLASIFPPGIENARLKKREVIGKKNTAGGLIVPQDPRFR